MNIVAVILARGGSKRVPKKNIRPLAGKPLIAYTIEAAKATRSLNRTIVSTDDDEVARIAAEYGAEVPFRRPAELAQDNSSSIDALEHAVEWLESNGPSIDIIVLLQPTSPTRRNQHIEEAIDLLTSTNVDTVTAVSLAVDHPFWCWQVVGTEIYPYFSRAHVRMSRQLLPPALIENGAVYVLRRRVLRSGTLYGERVAGYLMNRADAIDIDTVEEFERAERIIASAHSEKS